MRKLKFKVWDKKNKKWVENDKSLLCQLVIWKTATTFELSSGEDFEIVQFTGIEDKKGNDVYERDIIRVKYRNPDSEDGLPIWYENHEVGPLEVLIFFEDFIREGEVIGNVFETPELLKKVSDLKWNSKIFHKKMRRQ